MKRKNRIIFTINMLLCFALSSTTAIAEVYRWVDSQGKIHFGDKPPENEADKANKVTINESYKPDSLKTKEPPKWNGVSYKSKQSSTKKYKAPPSLKTTKPKEPEWLTKARTKCKKAKITNCNDSKLRGMNDPNIGVYK